MSHKFRIEKNMCPMPVGCKKKFVSHGYTFIFVRLLQQKLQKVQGNLPLQNIVYLKNIVSRV